MSEPSLLAKMSGSYTKVLQRIFLFLFVLLFILVIAVIIHLALPARLLQIAGNMSTLASLIYPGMLIYLNTKLPRPARARWWSIVVLALNIVFFGFFFANFAAVMLTGRPLFSF